MRSRLAVVLSSLILASALAMSSAALAQNTRGAATGPTTARGYDHPDQYVHIQDVKPADNMYPVVLHPEQDRAARDKLAAQAMLSLQSFGNLDAASPRGAAPWTW